MRIDLLPYTDCPPDAGDPDDVDWTDPLLHRDILERGGYHHRVLHDEAVNAIIEHDAPHGSLIVDVGGGSDIRSLNHDLLRDRGQRLVHVDCVWAIEGQCLEKVVHVRADLRRIPASFADLPLAEAISRQEHLLQHAQQSERVNTMRAELGFFHMLLTQNPIGTAVFAHVLSHLPPTTQRRLLAIAERTLMEGGRLHTVLTPACIGSTTSEGRGLIALQELLNKHSHLRVARDILLAPCFDADNCDELADLLRAGKMGRALTSVNQYLRAYGGVIDAVDGALDDGVTLVASAPRHPQLRAFLPSAVRVITLVNDHSTGATDQGFGVSGPH